MSLDIANGCSVGLFVLAAKTGGLMKNSGIRFEELCKTVFASALVMKPSIQGTTWNWIIPKTSPQLTSQRNTEHGLYFS
jgi:hypothetical protein